MRMKMRCGLVSNLYSSLFWGLALKPVLRKSGFYCCCFQSAWVIYIMILHLNFCLCDKGEQVPVNNSSNPEMHSLGSQHEPCRRAWWWLPGFQGRRLQPPNETGGVGAASRCPQSLHCRSGPLWWWHDWHGDRMERGPYHVPIGPRSSRTLPPYSNSLGTALSDSGEAGRPTSPLI